MVPAAIALEAVQNAIRCAVYDVATTVQDGQKTELRVDFKVSLRAKPTSERMLATMKWLQNKCEVKQIQTCLNRFFSKTTILDRSSSILQNSTSGTSSSSP